MPTHVLHPLVPVALATHSLAVAGDQRRRTGAREGMTSAAWRPLLIVRGCWHACAHKSFMSTSVCMTRGTEPSHGPTRVLALQQRRCSRVSCLSCRVTLDLDELPCRHAYRGERPGAVSRYTRCSAVSTGIQALLNSPELVEFLLAHAAGQGVKALMQLPVYPIFCYSLRPHAVLA